MQFHNLKRKTKNKKSRMVGRGGKRGKTSGRGGKGQTARAGHNTRPEIRDFIKRLPKLRGRGVASLKSHSSKPENVNFTILEKFFKAGDTVSPETLVGKGLLKKIKGNLPVVKILSDGELTKKLIVSDCRFSVSAKEKFEKAGGTVKVSSK